MVHLYVWGKTNNEFVFLSSMSLAEYERLKGRLERLFPGLEMMGW